MSAPLPSSHIARPSGSMPRKRKRPISCVEVPCEAHSGEDGVAAAVTLPFNTNHHQHRVPTEPPQPPLTKPTQVDQRPGTQGEVPPLAATGLTKAERKKLKRQRQREQRRASARAAAGNEWTGEKAAGVAHALDASETSAASTADGSADVDDLSEIFTSSQPRNRGKSAAIVGGDVEEQDTMLNEGDVVAESMDDLDKIFAEKRRKMAEQARTRRGVAADAADAPVVQGEGEWSYLSNRAKARRQHDGLNVYTEEEHAKSALEDVKGRLDGPCPFDCSCCF